MTAKPSASSRDRESLFRDILQYVEDCRTLLHKGELLELSGLDRNVASLCAAIEALDPAERQQYAEHIQVLFEELTLLGEELRESHSALAVQMRALDDYRKANIAYRTSDASDDFGRRDKKKKK